VEPELCVARLEALKSSLVPDPDTMPDAHAEAGAEPRIAATAPSASRVGPQLRSDGPQLRNPDTHVAKQSTNQR